MESFKITAILCVYNEIQNIELIKKSIDLSIFDEVIIIDGGSNDGTFELLEKETSIVLRKLSGVGLLAQRLHGISLASNDLVFLFNADDDLSLINLKYLKNEL